MKYKQTFTLILLLCLCAVTGYSQRNNEIACFDNFEYNNSGNSKMNAYLLAMVSYNMYPRNLLNKDGKASEVQALLRNNDQFETAFKNRLSHWFRSKKKTGPINTVAIGKKPPVKQSVTIKQPSSIQQVNTKLNGIRIGNEPTIEFIYENNSAGYDPEVMLISTQEYIILAWRGTDRVGTSGSIPFVESTIFNIGEWVTTNLNYQLVTPPSGISGRVHRGFNTSIQYNGLLNRLSNRLNELDVANKKLWITGHSLGGAHAQLAALYLKRLHQINPFAVYTYAAPGVGNSAFNREINSVLPGSRLQRFVFMNDPIPRLPSGLNDVTEAYGRTRPGQLNYYSNESGDENYHYDKPYRAEIPGTVVCMHNPHWYARAAFFELTDRNPLLRNTLPKAPSKPTEQCQIWDVMAAEGSNSSIVQNFLGINEDLEEGAYYIMNVKTQRFLNLKASDRNQDRKPIRSNSYIEESRFRWRVRFVENQSPLGGYTIGNGNKIIDADRSGVGQQNSEVFTYKREGGIATLDRRNQEWEIERNDDGSFFIKNIRNTRFSLKSTNDHRIVLDDAKGDYSKWFFVKAN